MVFFFKENYIKNKWLHSLEVSVYKHIDATFNLMVLQRRKVIGNIK